MTYTDILTFLSELSTIQVITMILTCTMCSIAIWTILTYISIRLANSAKDQNKTLLDNMDRLFNNNPKNKITKK
jgi:hypothetical protein